MIDRRTIYKVDTPQERRAEADRRVRRGIRFLDHHKKHWRENININRMDMMDGASCVLGQSFGPRDKRGRLMSGATLDNEGLEDGYLLTMAKYDGDLEENPHLYAFDSGGGLEYRDLKAAWRRAIG